MLLLEAPPLVVEPLELRGLRLGPRADRGLPVLGRRRRPRAPVRRPRRRPRRPRQTLEVVLEPLLRLELAVEPVELRGLERLLELGRADARRLELAAQRVRARLGRAHAVQVRRRRPRRVLEGRPRRAEHAVELRGPRFRQRALAPLGVEVRGELLEDDLLLHGRDVVVAAVARRLELRQAVLGGPGALLGELQVRGELVHGRVRFFSCQTGLAGSPPRGLEQRVPLLLQRFQVRAALLPEHLRLVGGGLRLFQLRPQVLGLRARELERPPRLRELGLERRQPLALVTRGRRLGLLELAHALLRGVEALLVARGGRHVLLPHRFRRLAVLRLRVARRLRVLQGLLDLVAPRPGDLELLF